MDNDSRALHHALFIHNSTFSNRLIPPQCSTEHHRKSFPQVVINLFNSSTSWWQTDGGDLGFLVTNHQSVGLYSFLGLITGHYFHHGTFWYIGFIFITFWFSQLVYLWTTAQPHLLLLLVLQLFAPYILWYWHIFSFSLPHTMLLLSCCTLIFFRINKWISYLT